MAESFDVLDESGRKTGVVMPRNEVHRRGLWHQGCDAWIYTSKGEVLLQKRSMNKETQPGLWTASATCHVSAGETPRDAIVRELDEEIGVKARPSELREIIATRFDEIISPTYHNREFQHVYIYKRDIVIGELRLQKEEVDAVKLMPFPKLKKELSDPRSSKKYVPFVYIDDLFRILGEAIGH